MLGFIVLVVAAFGQIPSNEIRESKLRACAGELERLATPAIHAEDCILDIGDAVYIEIKGQCALRASVISSDGTIILPLIGKLQAASLTISQLTASITTLLGKFVNHPVVTITLADNGRQTRYFVEGDVLQPGRYLLVAPVTILEAIDKAGGFKGAAHTHKIHVVREGGSVLKLDYKHLLKSPGQNVAVQNGDHILLLSQ